MKERYVSILNLLIRTNGPVSLQQLQQEFKVSARTIHNDVAALNDYLGHQSIPKIETIRNRGYQLVVTEEQIHLLKLQLSLNQGDDYLTREERLLDVLLSISFGQEPIFLYKMEEKYLISKSTIDEDMRQLRQRLHSYQIKIISRPKIGMVLEGKETAIRTMLYAVLSPEIAQIESSGELNRTKIVRKYLPDELLLRINQIFEKRMMKSGDSLHRVHFMLFTAIWILRNQKNEVIQRQDVPLEIESINDGVVGFLKDICLEFNLIVTRHEIDYATRILQSFNLKKNHAPINWLQLQMVTIQLIQFVELDTGIPFTKKESSLQQSLYNHIISMVGRVENDVQLSNPLLEKIKESYGNIFQSVKRFSIQFEKILSHPILEDEVAFLTIHFSTIVSEIKQEIQYSYRAVVICHQGIATGRLLAETLKEFFNIEILAVLGTRDLPVLEKLDVDLVFSTIDIDYHRRPLLVTEPIIQEEQRIRIQHFLDEHHSGRHFSKRNNEYTTLLKEIIDLFEKKMVMTETTYNELERLFTKYELTINKREVQPMIQDILEDENILLTNEKFTWQEAIRYVAQPLLDSDTITENYISAMIQNVEEYGPYIVIAPHMALAHARPEDGAKKLGLSVAIFENQIAFGDEEEQKVSVAFCLSAIDSFSHLNVMKSLVNLIRSTDKIEQLSRTRDITTVKQILFQS